MLGALVVQKPNREHARNVEERRTNAKRFGSSSDRQLTSSPMVNDMVQSEDVCIFFPILILLNEGAKAGNFFLSDETRSFSCRIEQSKLFCEYCTSSEAPESQTGTKPCGYRNYNSGTLSYGKRMYSVTVYRKRVLVD
eukprot:gb/GECG01000138.1/.p1 GENE.gb/GECG01000138.1/~~gb/GECG01000138.1/.p1  ORF type:complete len:138 (+),score=8.26 gb/GECG01000138.1/:1-414(+)